MAATIIQFPQTHSNIFLNLTQLINLASDNQVVEEYAEIMAVCHEEGNFKPGEIETLQEQIRTRRLENARPEEKPAVIPEKPGLYCYTPEMGEQKPKCQIEAERSRAELLRQTLPHQHSAGAERQRDQKRWCERGEEPQTKLSVHGWMV